MAGMPRLNDLSADEYLNAPMTRLEYLLMGLESLVSSRSEEIREYVSKGFKPNPNSYRQVTIKSHAKYARAFGRVMLAYEITDLGRPNGPMRDSCDRILSILQDTAPQTSFGYRYHFKVLGVLFQEVDGEKYTPSLTTLAKSFVHKVILESSSEDSAKHTLICQRTALDSPTQYQRYSIEFKGEKK